MKQQTPLEELTQEEKDQSITTLCFCIHQNAQQGGSFNTYFNNQNLLTRIKEVLDESKHTEQIAIEFKNWVDKVVRYSIIHYGGFSEYVGKTDTELFKMYLKEIKPTPQ